MLRLDNNKFWRVTHYMALAFDPNGSGIVFRRPDGSLAILEAGPNDTLWCRTLDLLLSTPAQVCGEVMLPIRQCLMSRQRSLSGIRKVYSHTQSLAQCQHWLARRLPGAERIAVVSNAEAARLAARERGAAAIGPNGRRPILRC